MNNKAITRTLQVLFVIGFGYIFRSSDCLSLNAVYVEDEAVFTCEISPYTGRQIWYKDSVAVADCGFVQCFENVSNPVRYSFTTDLVTGLFTFKIDPLESSDYNRIIECFDGADTHQLTIPAENDNGPNVSDGSDGSSKIHAAWVILVAFVVAVVVPLYVKNLHREPLTLKSSERTDTKLYLKLALADHKPCCCRKYTAIIGHNQETEFPYKKKSTRNTNCEFTDLFPMTNYKLTLERKILCMGEVKARTFVTTRPCIPADLEYEAKQRWIRLKWTYPNSIGRQPLKYTVAYDDKLDPIETHNTGCKIQGLTPDKEYKIEICAFNNGKNSLPIEGETKTPAVNVIPEIACYEAGESYVKCNIEWTVENFEKPKPFKESDDFFYTVICYLGEQEVDKKERIKAPSYTIPKLSPDYSYLVYVYAVYRSVTLEPRGMVELTTPYKPNGLKLTSTSTLIELKWGKPDYVDDDKQQLEYIVSCDEVDVMNTYATSYVHDDLIPDQTYKLKIYTRINGTMRSLPSVENIKTKPIKVYPGDVYYEPGQSSVQCNINWRVENVEEPKIFKNSNELLYNVTCYCGEQIVHKIEKIKVSSCTIPKLYPDRSYLVYVYAVYRSVTIQFPGIFKLETPYKPNDLTLTSTSTLIELKWGKPDYVDDDKQQLEYIVSCDEVDVMNTYATSYVHDDLIPDQTYKLKIYTRISGTMRSLPVVEDIKTKPMKVYPGDVCYEPGQSSVQCNINWSVENVEEPKVFKNSNELLYNVTCYCGEQNVHKIEKIKVPSCTIPKLYPDRSYLVYVYAVYRSVTIQFPGIFELETPYKPNDLKLTSTSTLIELKWGKPDYVDDDKQQLEYIVSCDEVDVMNTYATSYVHDDLIPDQTYKLKIYTRISGTMRSLPLVEDIKTKPIKVKPGDVCYEPGQSSVQCNINWSVENLEEPKVFKNANELLYNVLCYCGEQENHKKDNIEASSYTIPKLYPDCSYMVYVYAVYRSVTLQPPGIFKLETPYKPREFSYTAKSTLIEVKWKEPEHIGNQLLEYEVTYNKDGVVKTCDTYDTSCKIEGLIPGHIYKIKIITIINGMKSLPLKEKIRTLPSKRKDLPPLKKGQRGSITATLPDNVEVISEVAAGEGSSGT